MRPLRAIINAARDGKRLRPGEAKMLGEQLAVYWVDRCERCRYWHPCDYLDERGGKCQRCVDAVAREGR